MTLFENLYLNSLNFLMQRYRSINHQKPQRHHLCVTLIERIRHSKKGYTLPYYVTFVQKLHLTFSSKRTHNQYITVDGATRRESSPSFP